MRSGIKNSIRKAIIRVVSNALMASCIAFPYFSEVASSQDIGTIDLKPAIVVQTGHSDEINDAVFSPDGKLVASVGDEGVAILWEASSGREIRRFVGHVGAITSIAFSASGSYILTGSGRSDSELNVSQETLADFTVRLWESATGKEIRRYSGHKGPVSSVAFVPKNEEKILSSSHDGTVRLWDKETAESEILWSGEAPVKIARYSPDGNIIAIGVGNDEPADFSEAQPQFAIHLIDGATRLIHKSLVGHRLPIRDMTFSPDGKTLISNGDLPYSEGRAWEGIYEMISWDVPNGKKIELFDKFTGPAAFLANGNFIAAGCVLDGSYEICLLEKNTRKLKKLREFQPVIADTDDEDSNLKGIVTSVTAAGDKIAVARNQVRVGASGKYTMGLSNLAIYDIPANSVLFLRGHSKTYVEYDGERAKNLNNFERLIYVDDARYLLSDGTLWSLSNNEVIDLAGMAMAEDGGGNALDEEFSQPDQGFIGLSHNGRMAVFNGLVPRLVDLDTMATLAKLPPLRFARFSKDDSMLLIWDEKLDDEHTGNNYRAIVFSTSDGSQKLTAEFSSASHSRANESYFGWSPEYFDLAITPNGKYVFLNDLNQQQGTPQITRIEISTRESKVFEKGGGFFPSMAVSPDSRYLATTGGLIDVETGSLLVEAEFMGPGLRFSPDNRLALISGARLIELSTGKELWHLNDQNLRAFAFSSDNRFFATVSANQKTVSIWSRQDYTMIRGFSVTDSVVKQITFSPDVRYIVLKTEDGATRIWSLEGEGEICRLFSLDNGNWIVVEPNSGRFDTNNLEDIKGLHWIMPDDPMKPLPLEIFMRDYYEPRLLPRILAGEEFKPVRTLAELNRAQPEVRIASIERQKDRSDLVTVTLEVERGKSESQKDEKGNLRQTGVYDLRLFRDGQIVGQYSDGKLQVSSQSASDNHRLLSWRSENEVRLDATGKRTIKFENIKLPRRADIKQVEFSAYAFNEDRVKSRTSRKSFEIPTDLTPRTGRAYIIAVGVNAYESDNWNLRFAANDARLVLTTLRQKLLETREYQEVIDIELLSDYRDENGQRIVTEKNATKANFKAVLDLLAGTKVDSEMVEKIRNADKIQQATPEDLVLIAFASHGGVDSQGSFYLFPYDIGTGVSKATDEVLKRSISSDELSLWLRDVDAGEMVMIVDACHSAASVQTEDFKPGPMGSSGLGQLAYDKGMRILAATQADDVALENERIEQGLLTYALIREGIGAFQADKKPKDKKIVMEEWLAYALDRVPALYEEIRKGQVSQFLEGERAKIVGAGATRSMNRSAQRPQLFDFVKIKREVVLAK